ncbi:MAG: 2-amino-4-hydroxy-6-hydroxymethyldihydropteridine diphosphokinase [Treponema sp.]|nr:2-amino-4-hydroxy-6-hydroxymethyldihydropteridine diphosphokinase [Treponema sp.]
MNIVALGLGSNKKFSALRPEEILGGAVFELSKILRGVEISSVYRTKAMYVLEQDDFYNMALAGFLDEGISARDLLEKIHEIEASFGRDREKEIRFGPRPLDIDIEFFGNQKISEPDLQIPHPRLKERAFVLIPLLEVLDCLEKEENPTARSADTQAARAASEIISTHATARSADNIKGKIFCFCRDEISAALSSLDEADVEKIISARDFLPFIKSRLRNGTGAK